MAAGVLRRGFLGRTRRVALLVAAAFFGATITAGASGPTLPPPPPPPTLALPLAGTCLVTGSESFSPNVTLIPITLQVPSLMVGGSCVDNVFNNSVNVSMSGTVELLSCASGNGTLAGSVLFSTGEPPPQPTTAFYVGGPDMTSLTIVAPPFLAGADLAWTTGATTCPLPPGAPSTDLLGTVSYAYL